MNTRVSAYISDETKAEVEAFVKRYGITKARLIEEALQHHLQALREIPSDLVVPSRLVVTEDSMKRVAARLASDEQPTPRCASCCSRAPPRRRSRLLMHPTSRRCATAFADA